MVDTAVLTIKVQLDDILATLFKREELSDDQALSFAASLIEAVRANRAGVTA